MTSTLLTDFEAVTTALGGVRVEPTSFRELDEKSLLELNRKYADAQRLLGATGALIAGEIARRSAPHLGSDGLARRLGLRTPEQLIVITTGVTSQQARTAVKVGTMVLEAADDGLRDASSGEVSVPSRPWMTVVVSAVHAGTLSQSAAESIASGLGTTTGSVSDDDLATAATTLCAEAIGSDGHPGLDADRLFKRARQLRDELDLDGVALREDERRRQRGYTHTILPNGMHRGVWIMDPETGEQVKQLRDRATSPKLGGVRFLDAGQVARAKSILDDDRTPAQLASDAFLQLLLLGADGPTDFLVGSGAPVIKIATTRRTADTHRGLVSLEGTSTRFPSQRLSA